MSSRDGGFYALGVVIWANNKKIWLLKNYNKESTNFIIGDQALNTMSK